MIHSKLTKQDKELIRSEYQKVYRSDEKMIDFCVKRTSAYLEIDGRIVTIDKPHIQTNFCFGYGEQSAYDYGEAQDVCSRMSASWQYFIDYNLRHCEAGQILGQMNDAYWVDYWLTDRRYNGESNLVAIRADDRNERFYYEDKGWHRLTKEELDEYRKMLEGELEKFRKRLNTYLKRYGLSKCNYWTYWADE